MERSAVKKADIVIFHDDTKGFIPAIVEKVYECKAGEPELNLVAFCTGAHLHTMQALRKSHGLKKGQWCYPEEEPAPAIETTEKPRVPWETKPPVKVETKVETKVK